MQLVSAFLAYPFLINHLLYESLVPLAFVVGHPSFDLFFFGLGRNLPHLLVRQQLKAFLKIHEERRLPTLHPTPTSLAFAFRGHMASTSATHVTRTVEWRTPFLYLFFQGRRPRPRARPRPRSRLRRGGEGGGLGLDVRVEVRRTEGRPPPSS